MSYLDNLEVILHTVGEGIRMDYCLQFAMGVIDPFHHFQMSVHGYPGAGGWKFLEGVQPPRPLLY